MIHDGLAVSLKVLLESLGQPELTYGVNVARWPLALRQVFVESCPDRPLVEYLTRVLASRASSGRTRLQRALRLVLSDYDANALLDMYPMHLLSTAQAEVLLDRPRGGRLLDIGAGSGDVTAALAPLFDEVEVTEASRWARRRLRARGLVCHGYDVATKGIRGRQYDVVALMNVLDRTDRPVTLLKRCLAHMTADTRLMLSIALPYYPFVYAGAISREPRERLAVIGGNFSDALLRFVQRDLVPLGLRVERMTRLPYLSGGDSMSKMTVLDAAVLTCRKAEN